MNIYEKKQVLAIKKWKREEPGIVAQTFEFTTAPLSWLVTRMVPYKAMQAVLDNANNFAQDLKGAEDILEKSRVASIEVLRGKSLRLSDILANRIHDNAIALSAASGATLGAAGAGGMVLDLGALLTLSLRTIHKIGLCYGYERLGQQLVFGILLAASVGNRNKRLSAIETIHKIEDLTLEEVLGGAVQSQVTKSGIFFTTQGVGKQIGQYMIRRKSLQVVPVVGLALGAATNIVFVTDVAWAARRIFQERWLLENNRIRLQNV